MFNSFPIPKPDSGGGTSFLDWSAYQPVYDLTGTSVSVPATTWQMFVNVTGKGFLKWCRANPVTANSQNPDIRITVDDQAYTFDSPLTGSHLTGNEVNLEIPFKTSLKIEVYNRHTAAVSLICDYLYLLQQSTPSPNKVTILQQSQRKMVYFNTASTTLSDVLNIAGSGYLLSARFLGNYSTASSSIYGDITIDGVQKMTDRILYNTTTFQNKLTEVPGPIRFSSSLRIRTRIDVAGSNPIVLVWYVLD